MKAIFITSLLILVCSVGPFGQGTVACPTVEIREGDAVLGSRNFVAKFTPESARPKAKLFQWSLDKGKLNADDRLDLALVDPEGLAEGTLATLSVSITGFGCEVKTKRTFHIGPPIPKCPVVTVAPSSARVAAGKAITFTGKIEHGIPGEHITYNWLVEGGTIASGQGTPSITVEQTAGLKPGAKITARLDGPSTWSCDPKGAATVEIVAAAARKINEFGGLVGTAERLQLANVTFALILDEKYEAYILVYSGPKATKAEADADIRRIKNYYVTEEPTYEPRVHVLDGGRRDKPTREVWMVPPGGAPPIVTPAVACPGLEVREAPMFGGLHSLFAVLKPEDTAGKARYHWTIDKGKSTPDPTSAIALVDLKGLPDGTPVRVSLSVTGFGCELKGSGVFYVGGDAAKTKPSTTKCPTVAVTASTMTAVPGKPIKFTSNIVNPATDVEHTYNWQIEGGGTIVSGQGTSAITVEETDKLKPGTKIKVTLDVQGWGAGYTCKLEGTATVEIVGATARKIDEWGFLVGQAEKERLDKVMLQAVINHDHTAYVFVYAGRQVPKVVAAADVRRIRDSLEKTFSNEPGRVRVIDGGRRETTTREVWMVPPGAEPPKATPTVKSP